MRMALPAPPGTASKITREVRPPGVGYSVPSMSSRLICSRSETPSSSAYSVDRQWSLSASGAANASKEMATMSVS